MADSYLTLLATKKKTRVVQSMESDDDEHGANKCYERRVPFFFFVFFSKQFGSLARSFAN